MLAAITDQLRDKLSDRGVPYPVVYGPERMRQTPSTTSHITVMRDRAVGDVFAGPKSNAQNPNVIQSLQIGAKCRIYAHSTKSGANVWDHERLADAVLDQVVLALRDIVTPRKNFWTLKTARMVTPAEAGEPDLERWPGVIYELKFSVHRAVLDIDYAGESADEATMGGSGISAVDAALDTSDSPDASTGLPYATTRLVAPIGRGFSVGFSSGFEGGMYG